MRRASIATTASSSIDSLATSEASVFARIASKVPHARFLARGAASRGHRRSSPVARLKGGADGARRGDGTTTDTAVDETDASSSEDGGPTRASPTPTPHDRVSAAAAREQAPDAPLLLASPAAICRPTSRLNNRYNQSPLFAAASPSDRRRRGGNTNDEDFDDDFDGDDGSGRSAADGAALTSVRVKQTLGSAMGELQYQMETVLRWATITSGNTTGNATGGANNNNNNNNQTSNTTGGHNSSMTTAPHNHGDGTNFAANNASSVAASQSRARLSRGVAGGGVSNLRLPRCITGRPIESIQSLAELRSMITVGGTAPPPPASATHGSSRPVSTSSATPQPMRSTSPLLPNAASSLPPSRRAQQRALASTPASLMGGVSTADSAADTASSGGGPNAVRASQYVAAVKHIMRQRRDLSEEFDSMCIESRRHMLEAQRFKGSLEAGDSYEKRNMALLESWDAAREQQRSEQQAQLELRTEHAQQAKFEQELAALVRCENEVNRVKGAAHSLPNAWLRILAVLRSYNALKALWHKINLKKMEDALENSIYNMGDLQHHLVTASDASLNATHETQPHYASPLHCHDGHPQHQHHAAAEESSPSRGAAGHPHHHPHAGGHASPTSTTGSAKKHTLHTHGKTEVEGDRNAASSSMDPIKLARMLERQQQQDKVQHVSHRDKTLLHSLRKAHFGFYLRVLLRKTKRNAVDMLVGSLRRFRDAKRIRTAVKMFLHHCRRIVNGWKRAYLAEGRRMLLSQLQFDYYTRERIIYNKTVCADVKREVAKRAKLLAELPSDAEKRRQIAIAEVEARFPLAGAVRSSTGATSPNGASMGQRVVMIRTATPTTPGREARLATPATRARTPTTTAVPSVTKNPPTTASTVAPPALKYSRLAVLSTPAKGSRLTAAEKQQQLEEKQKALRAQVYATRLRVAAWAAEKEPLGNHPSLRTSRFGPDPYSAQTFALATHQVMFTDRIVAPPLSRARDALLRLVGFRLKRIMMAQSGEWLSAAREVRAKREHIQRVIALLEGRPSADSLRTELESMVVPPKPFRHPLLRPNEARCVVLCAFDLSQQEKRTLFDHGLTAPKVTTGNAMAAAAQAPGAVPPPVETGSSPAAVSSGSNAPPIATNGGGGVVVAGGPPKPSPLPPGCVLSMPHFAGLSTEAMTIVGRVYVDANVAACLRRYFTTMRKSVTDMRSEIFLA